MADLANDFEFVENRELESSVVVRYLFLSRLTTAIEQRRNRVRDEISELAATLFDTYRDQLTEYGDEDILETLESNPVRAAEVVERFLADERDRLHEQREDFLPFVDFFSDLGARIDEIEQSIAELYSQFRVRRIQISQ